ncbi:MAG TPA: hypothetical protein VFJ00_00650 [Candidatus Limnocylindria bacterium]|nr:hypothetical protein [Candidatus Limnocylindria bacterium]
MPEESPPPLPEDGPTRLVEGNDGELVERLSGGTATLLLVWLVGIGAGSALLAAWLLAVLVLRVRLGTEHLFGAPGLYVSLYGATGPTVLWLTGRAQGHSLRWFMVTAAKIGMVMSAILIGGLLLVVLVMGAALGAGALPVTIAVFGFTLATSVLWALATWAADRYIAGARVVAEGDQTS